MSKSKDLTKLWEKRNGELGRWQGILNWKEVREEARGSGISRSLEEDWGLVGGKEGRGKGSMAEKQLMLEEEVDPGSDIAGMTLEKLERLREERDELERDVGIAEAALSKEKKRVGELEREAEENLRERERLEGELQGLRDQLLAVEEGMWEEEWERESKRAVHYEGMWEEAKKTVEVQEGQLKEAGEIMVEQQKKLEAMEQQEKEQNKIRCLEGERGVREREQEIDRLKRCLAEEQEDKRRYRDKCIQLVEAVVGVVQEFNGMLTSEEELDERATEAVQEDATQAGNSLESLKRLVGVKFHELEEMQKMRQAGLGKAKEMVRALSVLVDSLPRAASVRETGDSPIATTSGTGNLEGHPVSLEAEGTTTTDIEGGNDLTADEARAPPVPSTSAAARNQQERSLPQQEDVTIEEDDGPMGSPEIKMEGPSPSPSSPEKPLPIPEHAVDYSPQARRQGLHSCLCGHQASRLGCLRSHIRYYTAELKFSCSECPRRFVEMSYLRRHLLQRHGILNKCKGCRVCGGTFATAAALEQHRRSVKSCEKRKPKPTIHVNLISGGDPSKKWSRRRR